MSTPERGAAPGAFLRWVDPPSTMTLSDVKPDRGARLGAAGRLSNQAGPQRVNARPLIDHLKGDDRHERF